MSRLNKLSLSYGPLRPRASASSRPPRLATADIEILSAFVPTTSAGCLLFVCNIFCASAVPSNRTREAGGTAHDLSSSHTAQPKGVLPLALDRHRKILSIRSQHLGWVSSFLCNSFAQAQFRVTRPNKLGSRLAIRSVLTPRNRKTLPRADIEKILGIRPYHLGRLGVWFSVQ